VRMPVTCSSFRTAYKHQFQVIAKILRRTPSPAMSRAVEVETNPPLKDWS
jgi:hypothetical protein